MKTMILVLMAFTMPAFGGGVVGWRTDGTGTYGDARPPLEWGTDRNVIWATSLSNWSNCSPVIGDDRIFVTAETAQLVCISKSSGQVLWETANGYEDVLTSQEAELARKANEFTNRLKELKRQVASIDEELKGTEQEPDGAVAKMEELTERKAELQAAIASTGERLESLALYVKRPVGEDAGYATATPVTDGQHVWAVFGTGIAVCYDLNGNPRWARLVDRPPATHGHTASPLLVGEKLVVHVNDIVALDAASGEEIWRTKAAVRYGTPVVCDVGLDPVIATPYGDFIRASDGLKLAGIGADLKHNSPLFAGGVVYFSGTAHNTAVAVKLPSRAEPFTPEILWTTEKVRNYSFSSPAYAKGLLYLVTDELLRVVDTQNGQVLYSQNLDGLGDGIYSSVTVAGAYVFISSKSGTTVVLEAGPEYRRVGENEIASLRSCLVLEGDRLYVRALDKLYCIGRQ